MTRTTRTTPAAPVAPVAPVAPAAVADISATEEAEFQTALHGLIRGNSQRRKALVKAFRLSLNAVVNRADTTRLTALTDATAEDADASKIRKAACRFAGGITRKSDADDWIDAPAASILSYNKKTGWQINTSQEARVKAQKIYEAVRLIDWDCLIVKTVKQELDCKAELTRLAKKFQKEKILPALGKKFLEFCEAEGLIEQ